jgi:hypothetical protein
MEMANEVMEDDTAEILMLEQPLGDYELLEDEIYLV